MADGPKVERPLPDIPLIFRPEDAGPRAAMNLPPLATRTRVLVVDDEALVLNLVVRTLAGENYTIRSADSGEAALRLLEDPDADGLDLLITDLRMPGMSGRDLAVQLRKRFPDLRVLYQTGFADSLFTDLPELAPYESFLEKPFSSDGLREAARLIMFGHIAAPSDPGDARDLRDLSRWEDRRLRAKLVRFLRRLRLA